MVTGEEEEEKEAIFAMGNSFKVPANCMSAAGIRPWSRGNNIKAPCSNSSKINGKANPRLRIYTFKELTIATNDFTRLGLFGNMYKGWVNEETLEPAKQGQGMAVAVKAWTTKSYPRLNEWQTEMDILGRISHPNLIKLLGHCRGDDKLFLVYEFMPNGSLDNHLFNTTQPLSWEQRLKIAIGAARALAFLHAPDNNIIHRDVKPAEILLDSNFNPKLSGLALARAGPAEVDSDVSTIIIGTIGYIAPEYVVTGHLNAKVDVYAFGVVLLQLLSGKKAIYVDESGEHRSLTEYAVAYLSDNSMFDQLMAPKLEKDYPFEAALRAGQLAGQCVSSDPTNRPSMNEVVEILEQINSDGSNKINRTITRHIDFTIEEVCLQS